MVKPPLNGRPETSAYRPKATLVIGSRLAAVRERPDAGAQISETAALHSLVRHIELKYRTIMGSSILICDVISRLRMALPAHRSPTRVSRRYCPTCAKCG